MRQLQFIEKGKLEWREAPDPKLEGDGEAIVRPVALATCDLDVAFVRGRLRSPTPFPFGHECVGEVTEVGDSVKSVKPGDLVSVPFQVSCGSCAACREGRSGNCDSVPRLSMYGLPVGPQSYGGFASDAVNVPYADAMLVPIPEGVAPAAVASLSDNIPDAWRTVAPSAGECARVARPDRDGRRVDRALFDRDRPGSGRGARRRRRRPRARPRSWPISWARTSSTRSSRTESASIRSPSTRAPTRPGSPARCGRPTRTGSAPASVSTSSRLRCPCSTCSPRGSPS